MRLRLAIFFVLAVVFSGFSQEADNWYQGKPIVKIVFEGLVNVDSSELAGITEPYIGQIFSDDVYWDILGRLYALEYFETINPTAIRADAAGSSVIIRFAVAERPIISRINFTGNSGLRRAQLLETISLKINDVATQIKLRMDELAITNLYLERGYPDVKISSEMQTASNSTIIVTFHIEEGEQVTIERFLFEGNSAFSARTLQRQLSLKTKGIFSSGAFQESLLIADRAALAQYYHDRGYIDANVIDAVREIRRDEEGGNRMTITFRIHEGSLYTFGGVTFEGNKIFSGEQLSELVYSEVGETVNATRIQADIQRVADLYYENGYIFNNIEPVPSSDPETGVLTYQINIVERGRAHIESIVIRGNEKTRDYVILREIPLEPGDIFSKTRVMEGLRNLYNLQFFSAVSPQTPPGSTDALMDLVIDVEEQPTTDLQFGFTFAGSAEPDTLPISFMANWNDRNFRGSGNQVGLDLTASTDTQSLSASYTHRWIFGLPLSGSFDLTLQHLNREAAMDNFAPFFYGDEDYAFPDGFDSYAEYSEANEIPPEAYLMDYEQWQVSLGVSTGYRWSTFAGNLGVGAGLRVGAVYSDYDKDLYRPFDPVLREENNEWTPATSLSTSVSLDQRDISYDPSSGYYAVQRFGWHGIFGFEKEHYLSSDTTAEWFTTLFNLRVTDTWSFKAVFGIHSGLSFILPKPGFSDPVIEEANQLAVDGMFIGRGWMKTEYRRKGYALWENWAEVRIPLVPGIIALDFFFDAAGIRKTPYDLFNNFSGDDGSHPGYNTFFMRFSVGGGFRFTIQQFPFRFSLAKRFLIQDGKVQWQTGNMGGSDDNPGSGIDFVISFSRSTY